MNATQRSCAIQRDARSRDALRDERSGNIFERHLAPSCNHSNSSVPVNGLVISVLYYFVSPRPVRKFRISKFPSDINTYARWVQKYRHLRRPLHHFPHRHRRRSTESRLKGETRQRTQWDRQHTRNISRVTFRRDRYLFSRGETRKMSKENSSTIHERSSSMCYTPAFTTAPVTPASLGSEIGAERGGYVRYTWRNWRSVYHMYIYSGV